MKSEIEKIIDVSKNLRITCNQSLFLIAVKNGIYTVDLPGEEVLDLVKKGYMKGNRITPVAFERLESALSDVKQKEVERIRVNSRYPNLTKETGEIAKVLGKHFFGTLSGKEQERLSAYVKNPIAIPFLHIFMQMFPSSDAKKNQSWNKHFETTWDNVTLRRLTKGTARKFQQIWKTKDIGLFLLGTYLFIQQSFNEDANKYFIKNMENYMSEYEHWYNQAEEMLEAGELDRFTKRKTNKNKSNNTFVI